MCKSLCYHTYIAPLASTDVFPHPSAEILYKQIAAQSVCKLQNNITGLYIVCVGAHTPGRDSRPPDDVLKEDGGLGPSIQQLLGDFFQDSLGRHEAYL